LGSSVLGRVFGKSRARSRRRGSLLFEGLALEELELAEGGSEFLVEFALREALLGLSSFRLASQLYSVLVLQTA